MRVNVFKFFIIVFFAFFIIFALLPEARAGCSDKKPTERPDLFQIDYMDGKATLYFTPVKDQITGYNIIYGTELHREDFGVIFNKEEKDGVISYTINHLLPNSVYYFRVRPVNNCHFGLFSKTIKINTKENKIFYKYKDENQTKGMELKKILVPTQVGIDYPEFNEIPNKNKNSNQKEIKTMEVEKLSFKNYLVYLLNQFLRAFKTSFNNFQ